MLGALSVAAYVYFARSAHETLEPLLGLPEGQAAYAATMRRVAATIALADVPLIAIVGVASYVLARLSFAPLAAAREREERFAADAAHELRTPLATIAAVAQAARGGDADGQSRALAKITALALEASALLGDLLTLMRDAPDQTRLHEPVDLSRIVAEIIRETRNFPVPKDAGPVVITLEPPPNDAYVIGDERALRQLAGNLLDNALRHARSSVTAGVSADANSVVFWVEDDGAGVAPGDRERVFERFYKGEPNSPGSGLGLAISRHIAARHRGTVKLEERARFVARFPKAPV